MCLRALYIISILVSTVAVAQEKPEVYKTYIYGKGTFIVDFLTLSSDNIFFYTRNCECGTESYGKGTYRIKGKKLYLSGFDSTAVFPRTSVEYIKSDVPTDSVIITTRDYFGFPIKSLLLAVVYNDSAKFYNTYEFVDSLGMLKLSKKQFQAFFLLFEEQDYRGFSKKESPYIFSSLIQGR